MFHDVKSLKGYIDFQPVDFEDDFPRLSKTCPVYPEPQANRQSVQMAGKLVGGLERGRTPCRQQKLALWAAIIAPAVLYAAKRCYILFVENP